MKQILNTMTLATLVGLASFANSALANPGTSLHPSATDTRTLVLHFGDLNPTLPADASELIARVRVAARNACIRNDEARQIFLGRERLACMEKSFADAIAGINAKRNVDLQAVAARHDANTNLNAAR